MNSNLMKETLDTAYDYLDKIIASLDIFSNFVNGGEKEKAAKIFVEIIDALEWIVNAFNFTVSIHKGNLDIQELNDRLPDLLEAFENSDYVLISDILNYEIKPVLEKWSGELETFVSR